MYRHRITRYIIQVAAFFAANNHFHRGIYQGPLKKFCFPGLNCYACPLARFSCPIGSLQHFITIRQFPFYILGFIGLIGVVSGRFICGFLCPFGFFQELLYKLRTFKIKLPRKVGYLKYVVLVVVIAVAYITSEPWFCKFCPVGTIGAAVPQLALNAHLRSMVGFLFYLKYAILILVVTFAILIKRPFCRLLCPLGAILGLLNKVTFFRLKVDHEKCNKCGTCYKVCPMDIKIYESATNSTDCIKCLMCKSACPQKAITISAGIDK